MLTSRITRFFEFIESPKSCSPFDQLPNELLNEIFHHFVLDTGYPLGYHIPGPKLPSARLFGPWILRGVCREWRDVVDGDSALWAYIILRDPECNVAECLRVMTTCSANRALVIHALVVTEAFALQLAEQRVRWREVHFVIDEQLFRAQSGIFGYTVFPILEKVTLITCSLGTYPNDSAFPEFVDIAGDLTKTLDLSHCPSLIHAALGASLQAHVSVTLPNAHITHLEIDNNGLPIINFRRSPVTEVQELVFPNLVWLHVIDDGEALQVIKAPNLQHLVLSLVYGYSVEGVLDLWKHSHCAIRTLEFRLPCPEVTFSHRAVLEVLLHAGRGLRQLCFSVSRMESLREFEWSDFRYLLDSVQYIEIRAKGKVATDHLLPDRFLPPDDYPSWPDRGEHLTRYEWWGFVAQTTKLHDMTRSLESLEILVLDWDRSVYRDRYFSPILQQSPILPGGRFLLLQKDDREDSELTDRHFSLLQTQILKEAEPLE